MNEEELREYILKLESENNLLKEEVDNLKLVNEEQLNNLNELNENVKNLKLKNYDLFTQLGHQTEEVIEVKENNNAMSLKELTNKIIKGE